MDKISETASLREVFCSKKTYASMTFITFLKKNSISLNKILFGYLNLITEASIVEMHNAKSYLGFHFNTLFMEFIDTA